MVEKNIFWDESSKKSLLRLYGRSSTRVYTKGIEELEAILKQKNQALLLLNQQIELENETEMLSQVSKQIVIGANELGKLACELTEKFLIFVVGMGKYGKSTLVNALVGQRVAEVDILPKTWKIDIYEESSSNKALIRFRQGQVKELDYSDALRLIEEEEQKRRESEKKVAEEFNKLVIHLDTLREKEELKRALVKQHLYISDISEVKWPLKSTPFLSHFRIVDTPGLYQDTLGLEIREDIREYYHKAHGVLWLIDATKISAKKSKQIVDELDTALKKIGSKPQNVIGVLNRIDLIRDSDDAVYRVTKEAEQIFGSSFSAIVPISAKEAETAVIENDIVLWEKSGIDKLIEQIEDQFLLKATKLKYHSALDGMRLIEKSLIEEIETYKKRLESDYQRFLELQTETDKTIEELEESFSEELEVFLKNYKKDVEANIGKLSETLLKPDLKESSKERFLREAIFRENYFLTQLNSWQYRMVEALERNYRYLSRKSIFYEFEKLSIQSVLLVYREHKLDDNMAFRSLKGEDEFALASVLTFAASGLLGPYGLVLTGIFGVTGLLRQIYVNIYQLPRLRKELEKHLDLLVEKAKEEMLKNLNEGLKTIKEQIDRIREETYSSLHGPANNTTEIIKTLEQVLVMLKKDEALELDIRDIILGGGHGGLARSIK